MSAVGAVSHRCFAVSRTSKTSNRVGYILVALGVISVLGVLLLAYAYKRPMDSQPTFNILKLSMVGKAMMLSGLLLSPVNPIFQLIDTEKRALWGHAEDQYQLGLGLESGGEIEKDEVEAVEWYRRAAAQGHAAAQNNLGICLYNGTGAAKDEAGGVAQFRLAAAQGDAAAQNNLGVCLEDKVGAVAQFRLAAAQRYAAAQYNLGVYLESGIGVAKDEAGAVAQYRLAADQNFSEAQVRLGVCYFNGTGVAVDKAEALIWLQRAGVNREKQAASPGGFERSNTLEESKVYNRIHFWMWQAGRQGIFDGKSWIDTHGIPGLDGELPTKGDAALVEMHFTTHAHRVEAESESVHEKSVRALLLRLGLLTSTDVTITVDGVEANEELKELDPCDLRVLEAFFIQDLLPPQGVHVQLAPGRSVSSDEEVVSPLPVEMWKGSCLI